MAWDSNRGYGQGLNNQMHQNLAQTTQATQYPSGYGQYNAQATPWSSGYGYGGGYGGGYYGPQGHVYQQAPPLPMGPPVGMPPAPPGFYPGMQMPVPPLMAPPPGLGRPHDQLGMPSGPQTPAKHIPEVSPPALLDWHTVPDVPPPEEPDTESAPGISADWMQQHAEKVGMLLSLPDNDINFTIEEVQTAVKTTLMDLEISDPGGVDVTSRGRTGPYEVMLSLTARDAIMTQGEVDVFQFEGDAEDTTFRAFVMDQYGAVVQSEKSQQAEANEASRAQRLMANKLKAEEMKGTQLRFFMDGTSQSAMLEKTKREEFFAAALKKLGMMINAKCHVKPHKMTIISVKDAFGNETNKGIIFLNLPKGTDGPEWVKSFRWDGMKYIHMGRHVLPVKIRMDPKTIKAVGLKQCCFLPRCRDIPCPALSDAYNLADCARAKRETRTHEPSWQQEKIQRQEEAAGRVNEARKKAEEAVARRREKFCKQWKAGRCFKEACANKHGTPAETAEIECSHGTACNRTACPYRHGAEE